ncbi:DUF2255 family protein [Gordonia sp. NPDC003424]
MSASWTSAALLELDAADELEIAARRPSGALLRYASIWVVCIGGEVYVRTWHRRDTGWYGNAVSTRRARIRFGDNETDVSIADLGDADDAVRSAVDAAYRAKYQRYGAGTVERMVSDVAAETTLRLRPE